MIAFAFVVQNWKILFIYFSLLENHESKIINGKGEKFHFYQKIKNNNCLFQSLIERRKRTAPKRR